MTMLKATWDVPGYFRGLREAPLRVLLLDYDGTLAPFRQQREEALPYPGVREPLTGILRRRDVSPSASTMSLGMIRVA